MKIAGVFIAAELLRIARHGVAPLVILAIERGWLPKGAKSDVVELLAIGLSFGLAYAWSLRNERKRNNQSGDGKPDNTSGATGAGGVDRVENKQRDSATEGGEKSK
jgi:hypothetical protein